MRLVLCSERSWSHIVRKLVSYSARRLSYSAIDGFHDLLRGAGLCPGVGLVLPVSRRKRNAHHVEVRLVLARQQVALGDQVAQHLGTAIFGGRCKIQKTHI